MTAKTLNLKLIEAFPELERAYREETEWQEGDDTGSHVVFSDVLVPVILTYLKSQNHKIAKKYLDFLEGLLASGDDYASDVVATSVIENIFFDEIVAAEVEPLLGIETLKVWRGYAES